LVQIQHGLPFIVISANTGIEHFRESGQVLGFSSMTLQSPKNHFTLFALPVSFDIDVAALDRAYRELQREVHPDRFAAASAIEQRMAAERATDANAAYRTLKSPLARGRHVLHLNGMDTEEESNTAMPPGFLIQQLEWREAVVEARARNDVDALNTIASTIRDHEKALVSELRAQLNGADFLSAKQTVRKLRFIEKLAEEIGDAQQAVGG
jgi:molecular chaperone HscB